MTIRDIAIALGFDVDDASFKKAEKGVADFKNKATKVLGAIGVGLSITGIAKGIKDCVALSSEVEEMQNKFDVVFQGMTDDVEDWAQSYADAIGRNKNDIKSYLADQQNLLVGFGMTREAGADLSKQMTTLALDLASFANIDETSAVEAMTKAVMGESESAKRLGAVLNDSTREQAMLSMGLKGTYNSLDQLTKMQVNYQAILSQSPDAIGDCERSLGSYASTAKSFQAKLKELKTIIGQFFIPSPAVQPERVGDRERGGDQMMQKTAAEMLAELLKDCGVSQRKLAESMGCSPQVINSRFRNNAFKADDWLYAIRLLGYQVTLEPEGDSPRMERRQGVCPKFKKVVDGTTYDSRKATPICHRWLSDGGLQELYQNEEGRHFIANLTTWPQIEVTILPCTDDEAKDFSGICG